MNDFLINYIPVQACTKLTNMTTDIINGISAKNAILANTNLRLSSNGRSQDIYFSENAKITMEFVCSADDFIEYFIENLIVYKKTDTAQAVAVIKLAHILEVSQSCLGNIYIRYNFGGYDKGEASFDNFTKFSKALQNLVVGNEVSLQIASLFHNYFENDYDGLLAVLNSYTFSEMNKNLQYLVEICKTGKYTSQNLAEMLKKLDKISQNRLIYKLRYPDYEHLTAIFEKYLDSLKLKNRVSSQFLFEKQSYSLNVTFKNADDLATQLTNILAKLKSVEFDKDLFELKNLFDKLECEKK